MTLHNLVLTEITSKIVDGNISTTNLTSRLINFLLKNIPKFKHFQKTKNRTMNDHDRKSSPKQMLKETRFNPCGSYRLVSEYQLS